MIVWINGAFGVGKTTAAHRLAQLLPGTRVLDPERLGWVLQRTVGRLQRGDFQHLASWRRGTVRLTRMTAGRHSTVVVPMSVLRPDYLDEMLDRLRAAGYEVGHVTLHATPPTLHARIAADEVDTRALEWRRHHVDVYGDVRSELAARGELVDTTERTPDDVAATIAREVLSTG